ncbi:MAG: SufD family Fe-S cluster assembly protein [Oscillospiraceae bacterium]|nr:SufD family Fe-S cluster assembly protein [Oscillospiraceae bacterium]
MLNDVVSGVLDQIADGHEFPEDAAVNIRVDGAKAQRRNTKNIEIITKTDKDGIDVYIAPNTVHGSVHIPVVLTKSGFKDKVYNDFYVGEGAQVEIVAGCGINNCGCDDSQHDGIHTFHIGKNASVVYKEKHYGEGTGTGKRILNPVTEIFLEEGASITLDTSQIRGVDDTKRYTKAEVGEGAEIIIQEKLCTHQDQTAVSEMDVFLNGAGAKARVISRSVAQDSSSQTFYPRVQGNAPCFGHVSCDAIIMGQAKARSIPEIACNDVDATLIHEAAIGRISGEQILKLLTLGLTEEEAEEKILEGFLR